MRASRRGWVRRTNKTNSGLTLGTILHLLLGDDTVLHMPLLVADPLDEIRLRFDHDNASAECVQCLGESLHGLYVQIIRRLIHGDEMRLRPEHGSEREPHLLTGREATDLPVAAHLLIDAEGLAVSDDLATGQGPLIQAGRLGSDPLVARNDDFVQAHHLEFGDLLNGVLLDVVEALPSHLVSELVAHLCPADQVPNRVTVLAVLFRELCALVGFLVVLRVNEAPLKITVVPVLEALRDVHEGRCVEKGSQGLQVVLLHVGHAQVAVARNLAPSAVLVLRRAGLTA
mmetsp:Transcript_117836/g.377942  ORF Transcript_117836/g.377942 Transcript_117836/m.377942 type:complete len:286 (+) Transcript_117836:95-952(+)